MKTCKLCAEWAQWQLFRAEHPSDEDNQKSRKLKLVKAGPKLHDEGVFCGQHKQELEASLNADQKFVFIGAVPLGA